jgi:hypothetical protein
VKPVEVQVDVKPVAVKVDAKVDAKADAKVVKVVEEKKVSTGQHCTVSA